MSPDTDGLQPAPAQSPWPSSSTDTMAHSYAHKILESGVKLEGFHGLARARVSFYSAWRSPEEDRSQAGSALRHRVLSKEREREKDRAKETT